MSLDLLQTYPESPYYNGRWSNGPTWIEVAASLLGASLTDYGAGLLSTSHIGLLRLLGTLERFKALGPRQ